MSARATLVIGAGADELACAHYLARAGHRVLVLEQHAATGGVQSGWVPPRLVRELGLAARGYAAERPDPWAAVPLAGGGRLELWQDMGRTIEAIRRVSPRDAAKWPAFCASMARCGRVLEALYDAAPPAPLTREPGELLRLAAIALRARGLGRGVIPDFLRLLPMPVADLLDDWFEHDGLKAALGAAGVMHLAQGPRSGGTAFVFLHHHVGSPQGVFRPPCSNARHALAALPGIEIRRAARVERIVVREGRAAGVVLAGGEEISALQVVSGVDPRRTLTALVEPQWLDPQLRRAAGNIRARGVSARVELVFDRPPAFSALTVASSLDAMERAYDDAKYRRVSAEPWLEARRAAGSEATHRVHVHVQYAPYAPAGDWSDDRAAALGDKVAGMILRHAPELDGHLVSRSIVTPSELERLCGDPEGQPYHAELTLDQALWMRPLPELARYRTPVAGLYLCGPGMHPGAGIAGASGANAARAVIGDAR